MYQIDDYVVYGNYGLCRVKDISTLDMEGVNKDRQYYFLTPVYGNHGVVYTPVDNDKVVIRKIMTKDEAEALLAGIKDIVKMEISAEKAREDRYRECIRSCNGIEWMRLILTIRSRMQERIESGKKSTALDERYLKLAEDYLYTELAVALDTEAENVPERIKNYL